MNHLKFAWRRYKQHPRAMVADALLATWLMFALFSRVHFLILIIAFLPILAFGKYVYDKDIKK